MNKSIFANNNTIINAMEFQFDNICSFLNELR